MGQSRTEIFIRRHSSSAKKQLILLSLHKDSFIAEASEDPQRLEDSQASKIQGLSPNWRATPPNPVVESQHSPSHWGTTVSAWPEPVQAVLGALSFNLEKEGVGVGVPWLGPVSFPRRCFASALILSGWHGCIPLRHSRIPCEMLLSFPWSVIVILAGIWETKGWGRGLSPGDSWSSWGGRAPHVRFPHTWPPCTARGPAGRVQSALRRPNSLPLGSLSLLWHNSGGDGAREEDEGGTGLWPLPQTVSHPRAQHEQDCSRLPPEQSPP